MWLQETRGAYASRYSKGHRARSSRIHSSDRKRRTKTANLTHSQDRVPQMWKQPSLRMASTNQRERRVLNTIFQMHKMQLYFPGIQLTGSNFRSYRFAVYASVQGRNLPLIYLLNENLNEREIKHKG